MLLQESGPRRHLRDLGGAGRRRAGGAARGGNTKTKIVTLDLSEPVALDMVKGGNVIGIVADKAYELGRAMAASAHEGAARQGAPPFIVAPALTVTKENVAAGLAGVAASRRAAVGPRRGEVSGSAPAARCRADQSTMRRC